MPALFYCLQMQPANTLNLYLKTGESLTYGTGQTLTYGIGETLTCFEAQSAAFWKRVFCDT